MTMEIKYGDGFTRDFDTLPDASRKAIAQFGMAHYLGNVQASALVSRVRSAIAGTNGKATDVERSEIKAWRQDHPDQVKTWQEELFAAAVKDLDSGQIGVREGGPRLDPVEREFRNLILARAKSICETIGAALPGVAKNGEAAPTILFPGDNVTLTREQLLDRIRNSTKPGNGGDLFKQAKQTVEARERVMLRAKHDAEASTEVLF